MNIIINALTVILAPLLFGLPPSEPKAPALSPPLEAKNEVKVPIRECLSAMPDINYVQGSFRKGYVQVNQLTQNGHYGHEIQIRRKGERVNAKYFASGSVYSKYNSWKRNKDIVMVCSGAFTGSSGKPVGITVDNGTIVNRMLDESMDGLVIVYNTGGIVFSDLDNRYLRVNMNGTYKDLDLRNYRDLSTFLNWAAQNDATVFQTQLLAFDGKLRLVPSKAHTELATRRFLVLAKSPTGELFHLVYNIEQNVYLGDATNDVYHYVKNAKYMDVIGMINLDTGAYDILSFYNDYGSPMSGLKGAKSISSATNLVTYYFE